MTITPQEAEFEQGMEELYEEFRKQYEDEVIFDKVHTFYKNNPEIVKEPYLNLDVSKELYDKKFYTASFIHSIIAVEVVIKVIALKPILYSLSFDSRASELLYNDTFKQKSIPYIPSFYYEILKDLTKINIKEIIRNNSQIKIWEEINHLQSMRNKIIHQGVFVQKVDSERALDIAIYIFNEIIPKILDRFQYHVEHYKICYGSRDYIKMISKIDNGKK